MSVRILTGDCMIRLRDLEPQSVQCVVTSPPYFGLRDYGQDGQIGLEETPAAYIERLVNVFREVWRVLRDDGTVWLNIGDSYSARPGQRKATDKPGAKQATPAGSIAIGSRSVESAKPKDLLMIPARVALALQADGWYLRSDIIWSKSNPMPESVKDRPTSAHEHVFLMTKSARYFYDAEAVKEQAIHEGRVVKASGANAKNLGTGNPTAAGFAKHDTLVSGRNPRNVWHISNQPYPGAHFAVFPPAIPERCIKAGSCEGDTILDPFGGAGTTGLVANRLGRNAVLIELSPDYAEQARGRIAAEAGTFASVEVVAAGADEMEDLLG